MAEIAHAHRGDAVFTVSDDWTGELTVRMDGAEVVIRGPIGLFTDIGEAVGDVHVSLSDYEAEQIIQTRGMGGEPDD